MEEADEEICRPRLIDTSRYVKDRIEQIADLLEVVDTRPKTIGPGRRTAFQRLPRHIRRRAMSHNLKRLPRLLHPIAGASARHRDKPPSRLWRRRPSRMLKLKRLARLKKRDVWLETHIWHAKRFRMEDHWGYRIPMSSYQRGFRPTYRYSAHSTCIIDQSYLHCMQLVLDGGDSSSTTSSPVATAVERLNSLCAPSGMVPHFGFKPALDGSLEIGSLLYRPNSYPRGFIGPVLFSWSSPTHPTVPRDCRQLQLWIHPATQPAVRDLVLKTMDAKPTAQATMPTPADAVYEGPGVKIYDLRQRLARFQLTGPTALQTLFLSLHLVGDERLEKSGLLEEFRQSHDFWRQSIAGHQPGNLRDGTTISLLVDDPRTYRSKLMGQRDNAVGQKGLQQSPIRAVPVPAPHFWSWSFRREQWEKRMGNAELQARQSTSLGAVQAEAMIPVLVVVKSSSTTTSPNTVSTPLNRVDLIVPGGWGLDFWLTLQFANARAVAHRDKLHLDFEAGTMNFPSDHPDTSAGQKHHALERDVLEAKRLRKPRNRRVHFDRLRIRYPFSFEWAQLADEWAGRSEEEPPSKPPEGDNDGEGGFYVLRDRRVLAKLSTWLERRKPNHELAEEILASHPKALVPVRLTLTGRGTPRRLALICLPTAGEEMKDDDSEMGLCERQSEAKNQDSTPLLSVDLGELNVLVSLDEMFPDGEAERQKKEALRRQKLKQTRRKAAHRKATGEVSQMEVDEKAEEEQGSAGYIDSCTRPIIGRITRADYSFVEARGIALGYVALAALPKLRGKKVLIRNITSNLYYAARISVIRWSSIVL